MKQPAKLKRIEFSIVPEQEPQLAFLMKRWGLNRCNTLRIIIGNAYNAYHRAKAENASGAPQPGSPTAQKGVEKKIHQSKLESKLRF